MTVRRDCACWQGRNWVLTVHRRSLAAYVLQGRGGKVPMHQIGRNVESLGSYAMGAGQRQLLNQEILALRVHAGLVV